MRKIFDEKLIKFALVGVLNTIVGYAINLLALNVLGLPFEIALICNYVPTSVMSFFLNKYFTFKSGGNLKKEALRFAINIAVCLTLASGIAKTATYFVLTNYAPNEFFEFVSKVTFGLLKEKANITDNLATLVGMGLFVIFNYMGQRFFAFKEEE